MNLIGKLLTRGYAARQIAARLLGPAAAPNPLARELEANGVVVLPGALPQDVVSRVRSEVSPLLDLQDLSAVAYTPDAKTLLEASGTPREKLGNYYAVHVKNFQRRFDPYRDAVPVIAPVLDAYYASRYYVRDVYCYRTQPIPEVQGSFAWHQDNYPPGSLKVMIHLSPVLSADDGPLAIAVGSHAGFRPELGRIGDRHEDAAVRGRYRVLECLGGPGTVIIFNNNTIHRATDPRRGRRDVVNFTLFPCLWRSAAKGLDLDAEKSFLKRYTR